MYPIVKTNKKNLGYVEYDPEKYILIHTLNREGDGNYIVTQHKKELEKKNKKKNIKDSKNSKNVSSKVISQNFPIFNNDDEQFEKDILQFVIQNRIYSDNDFDIMENGIIKNNEKNNIDLKRINFVLKKKINECLNKNKILKENNNKKIIENNNLKRDIEQELLKREKFKEIEKNNNFIFYLNK